VLEGAEASVDDRRDDAGVGVFVLAVGAEEVAVGGDAACEIPHEVVLGAVVLHLEQVDVDAPLLVEAAGVLEALKDVAGVAVAGQEQGAAVEIKE
jgi:hypothetical protein